MIFAVLAVLLAILPAASPSTPLELARLALDRAVGGEGGLPALGDDRWPTPVFLTVVLDGRTRACQGSVAATTPRLGSEIEAMARRAAQGDSRHPPLQRGEVERARIVLSFPEPPRPWDGTLVDPRRWGLLVETSSGSGVLLPGEARTFEWMLAEARRRAGGSVAEPGLVRVFRTRSIGEGETQVPAIEANSR